jgi:hypothetical protein
MSKHTEAPWKVADAEPLRLKGGCYYQAVFSLSDATYRPARAQGETAEECQANADLIATAPDLLRLLKALQPILWNDGPLARAYQHLEDEIDAVIARAEGREA